MTIIWKQNFELTKLNQNIATGLGEMLEIKIVGRGNDWLMAQMPVKAQHKQPFGIVHGGATAALAESTGSAASHLFVDLTKFEVRGFEITANHIKSKKDGIVTATARPIHRGKTTHLWEVKVTDETGSLISLCKLSMIVLSKKA